MERRFCGMPIYIYYSVFQYLEENGYLDLSNNIHMFCLHSIFEPRINAHLQNFVQSWNNHPIRTAGNRMPNQLWICGLAQLSRCSDLDGMELQHELIQVLCRRLSYIVSLKIYLYSAYKKV